MEGDALREEGVFVLPCVPNRVGDLLSDSTLDLWSAWRREGIPEGVVGAGAFFIHRDGTWCLDGIVTERDSRSYRLVEAIICCGISRETLFIKETVRAVLVFILECGRSLSHQEEVWIWDPVELYAAWSSLYDPGGGGYTVNFDDVISRFQVLPRVHLSSVCLASSDWISFAETGLRLREQLFSALAFARRAGSLLSPALTQSSSDLE
jgi:hypothetical protein